VQNPCFALILASHILLAGCTVSASCDFTNSSGQEIQVELISSGETVRLGLIKPGETKRIEFWRRVKVRVMRAGVISEYKTPEPPAECAEFSGWGPWVHRTFKAELQADGKVHLLCSENPPEFPIEAMPLSGHN